MMKKINVQHFIHTTRKKVESLSIKAKIGLDTAAEVLTDKSGGNHTTEIIVGIAVSVLVGIMIYNAITGYFSDTLFPKATDKINNMFS